MKTQTVKELIFWSYANLAMAHSAVSKKQKKYGVINYSIRSKLFKGLKNGTMNIRSLFDDEKVKLSQGLSCNYCGALDNLSLDHIFPQKYGGRDAGDNLIYACKSCNSSKGKKDLMQWYFSKGKFPPLLIIRRYLKLIYNYCETNCLLDSDIDGLKNSNLPFDIMLIPTKFPKPDELSLTALDERNFKIVVWNTEWAKPKSKEEETIREIVREVSPDIICITEGYIETWQDFGHVISSEEDYGYKITEGRRKVILISKNEWNNIDTVGTLKMPKGRFVSGITKGINIFGVCVPWKDAHVRSGMKNRKVWEDHINYLKGLKETISNVDNRAIIIGDFNQRVPRKYQPQNIYNLMMDVFDGYRFETSGLIKPINQLSIDHCCVKYFKENFSVEAISNYKNDLKLSDHFGLIISI